jgi:hypothetical protein
MALKTKLTDLTPSAQRFKQEIVLPSGGYSNPTELPGGKLTVYPWDTRTSEWMTQAPSNTSGNLAFMVQLVARVTHLPEATVKTFVASELTLVVMVARALTFPDNSITYNPTCPHCGAPQNPVTLRIPDQLEKVGIKAAGYDHDDVTLALSGDVVAVRPITVAEEEAARGRPAHLQKQLSDGEALIVAAIRSVGGGTPVDMDELIRWWRALHPADVEQLTTTLGRLTPGISTTLRHRCDREACKKEFSYELNLRTDFFRL